MGRKIVGQRTIGGQPIARGISTLREASGTDLQLGWLQLSGLRAQNFPREVSVPQLFLEKILLPSSLTVLSLVHFGSFQTFASLPRKFGLSPAMQPQLCVRGSAGVEDCGRKSSVAWGIRFGLITFASLGRGVGSIHGFPKFLMSRRSLEFVGFFLARAINWTGKSSPLLDGDGADWPS